MEIIAHRGASHDAPENTLAAVRLAWEQGADALEIDVHLTRDGRLAVIHDADTRRTTGVTRVVAEATLADLQRLDAGAWKQARFVGERIPALDDVLPLVPPAKRVFIEIKGGPDGVDALQACLLTAQKTGGIRAGQIAIISFDLRTAEMAKCVLPQHDVCWIADSGSEAPCATLSGLAEKAREARLDGIDVQWRWPIDERSVQQIHAGGFKVFVWTVDDPDVARRLVDAGVDGITTNRPGWLRERLAAR